MYKKKNVIDVKSILIISLIVVIESVLVVLLVIINRSNENEKVNQKLQTEQIINIFQRLSMDFGFKSVETEDAKIKFAFNYMKFDEKYIGYITYDQEEMLAKVNKQCISEVVEYIFDKKVDFNNSSYEVEDEYIKIPVVLAGGGTSVYKLNRKEYDENLNTYTVYIDCLEPDGMNYTDLINPSYDDYDPSYVLATMVFRYKLDAQRYILLDYFVQTRS